MTSLDLSRLDDKQRPTGVWASAILHAIAREETANHRRPCLTEPNLDTWNRFRGRLTSVDLVAILFEDGAVLHRIPFDPAAVCGDLSLRRLPESVTDRWLGTIGSLALSCASADYVHEQARLLGLPTRLARSDLHVVKPHHKVLELPGTGGQLAYHLVTNQKDLVIQDNFVVACCSWQEATLAGLLALELCVPHSNFASRIEPADFNNSDHPIRQRSFDFVIGLHPDKGGLFQMDEQLAIWYPNAKIVLV